MYDYDRELVLEISSQIKNSLETILYRFEPIERIEDFTDSPWGMEKLDSIWDAIDSNWRGCKKDR